jgi:putative glutamine amidotransferase
MKNDITIGITDCGKYDNYRKWIEKEIGASAIKLSHHINNIGDIEKCDGIVLSGGEDVHPRLYNKAEYVPYCDEINEQRDAFEWEVLSHVESKKLPLLGICRGLQIANVFFGGTLLPDIPSFGKFNHSKTAEDDRYHTVEVDPNSELKKIVGQSTGEINSAHHQSAELIGKGLVSNAISSDGVIEGLERKEKDGHPFFMLVQWHPERMKDQESLFVKNIKREFLEAVRNRNGELKMALGKKF